LHGEQHVSFFIEIQPYWRTRMNKKLVFALLFTSSTLTACLPMDFYGDGGIPGSYYEPGGALADKHEGPMILANATQEQMLALVPVGMTKEKVIELLGAPASVSQASDGSSVSAYRHTFTSSRQQFVKLEFLTITFGADKKVSKVDASVNSNHW
jgi:outer membrane protein assembly factor BamE (lipoprotein component of BamABCDE complex)